MRLLACTALLLCGCTASPVRMLGPAKLVFATDPGAQFPGYIWSIDGHHAPKGPLLVAPGALKIEYECPNQVSVDGLPSIVVGLAAGKSYEMYCVNGKAFVRPNP